jgi:DNA modification methylase
MKPLVHDHDLLIYQGGCLEVMRELEDDVAAACVTSPPYLDARPEYPSPSPEEFGEIFKELRRVVSGPLLLNVGRLWRKRRELLWWVGLLECAESAGWDLCDTLVHVKMNANPIKGEVLTDSHEMVFLLGDPDSFNTDDIRTPYSEGTIARMNRKWKSGTSVKGEGREQDGREINPLGARPRSFIATNIGREKGNPHPAPMALDLANHLVQLAVPAGGTIIDCFGGSGNTAIAARTNGRKSILIELSSEYAELAASRLAQQSLLA